MALLKLLRAQVPRQIAARVLIARTEGRHYAEDLLDAELESHPLPPADRALCQELVYGVTRWQATLDRLIDRKTGGRTQKAALRVLLQMALYQMFWLDRIPNHAAVNEAVELARQLGFGPQSGFVNAVLRGYARERAETEKLLAELKVTDPAAGWSHPDWLYQRWLARWGADKAARLMEWNNTPPPTYARVNTLKTDAATLATQWQAEGVKFVPRQWDWTAGEVFQLESHPPLATLPSFQSGLFYIQDPSTLLAVHELNPQAGETILDLCAAPGGKTTLIAQRLRNDGRIIARDTQPDRLVLVRENCARLGVTCVSFESAILSSVALAKEEAAPAKAEQFDRILIDAPCSNTGVMRRRIDLRWRLRPEEIERLKETQLELLRQSAGELKPGGTLIYSTCSLEPEENDAVIEEFLRSQPAFTLESRREMLPFADGVDGAFVARLRKSGSPA